MQKKIKSTIFVPRKLFELFAKELFKKRTDRYCKNYAFLLVKCRFYEVVRYGGRAQIPHGRTVIRLSSQRPAWVAMNWTPVNGRRRKGRPRTTWRRTLQSDLALVGIRWEEAEDTAPDRSFWRQAAARCALWHRWN